MDLDRVAFTKFILALSALRSPVKFQSAVQGGVRYFFISQDTQIHVSVGL
jgi:hypothetical protein